MRKGLQEVIASASQPVAWAVVRESDGVSVAADRDRGEAYEIACLFSDRTGQSHAVVPLHFAPTLTDEERGAIANGIYLCEGEAGTANENVNTHAWAKSAGLLRGLLERLGK
jgi:hypothetical protein